MHIELTEDVIQIIQRRQRLMDCLDSGRGTAVLGLIEAENNELARILCEAYHKSHGFI